MTEALEVPASADAVRSPYSTALTFESLGVAETLCKALADQGITTAFPIQALTIADALAGRDVCGKAKTGSGKTLAFGLPLLQRLAAGCGRRRRASPAGPPRRPRALVLLPTRELAVQVHEVLAPLAERHRAAHRRRLRRRRHRAPGHASSARASTSIIATPGRLIDLGDRGELSVADLEVLVLDEADRMADMGFMPQVEWVLRRRRAARTRRCCSPPPSTAPSTGSSSRYLTDPVVPRGGLEPDADRDRDGAPLLPGPPDGQGQGRRGHLPGERQGRSSSSGPSAAPTASSSTSARRASGAGAIHGDLRQSQPRAGPRRLHRRQAPGARGHRRRRPRARHRRRRRRRPLRPARGPQGLPAPLGPHGAGRRGGRRGHPGCCGTRCVEAEVIDASGSGSRLPDRRGVLERPRAWPTSRPGARPRDEGVL